MRARRQPAARCTAISDPAAGKDHDSWLVGDGFAAVADGATPLTGPGRSARVYADALLEALATGSLAEAVTAASSAAAPHAATAGAAWARWDDEQVRAWAVGDCRVDVLLTQGELLSLADTRLTALDDHALRIMSLAQQDGLSAAAARQVVGPLLLAHRALANVPGGYAVAGADPAVVARELTVPRTQVRAVLLSSDGFSCAFDRYALCTAQQLLTGLAEGACHLQETVAALREVERADPELLRFPRFGVHDDCTAVLVRLTR